MARRSSIILSTLFAGTLLGGAILSAQHWLDDGKPEAEHDPGGERESGEASQNTSNKPSTTRYSTRMMALESKLRALHQRVDDLDAAATEGGSRPPAADVEAAAFAEAYGQKDTLREQVLQEAFRTAFESEPVDEAWGSEMDQSIRVAFNTLEQRSEEGDTAATGESAALPPPELKAVECRTALCRVEIVQREGTAQRTFDELLQAPAFSAGSYFHPGEHDGTTVAYVFRAGHEAQITATFGDANAVVAQAETDSVGL